MTRRRLGRAVGATTFPTALRLMLTALLAAVALPFLGGGSAYACSCATGSDKDHAARADAVFTGTLTGTKKGPRTGSSTDPVTYTFAVSRVYKGQVVASQPVTSVVSGASCGLELDGTGPFLVFASTAKRSIYDGDLNAGLCDGTRAVGKGVPASLGEGREIVAEPVSALGPTTDDDDSRSNLGLLALAGGLLIVGGAVITTRKRRHH